MSASSRTGWQAATPGCRAGCWRTSRSMSRVATRGAKRARRWRRRSMDEQVLRAMARWPDVPAVHGWLRLGRRGQWFLIDRNSPGFDERLHGEGSPIGNEQINEFIGRNYQAEADGRWYWQNGPQRVYVDLE